MTAITRRGETITGLPALTVEALVALLRTTPPAVLAERFFQGDLARASVATGYDLACWWCTIVDEEGPVAFVRFDEETRRVDRSVCCLRETRAGAGPIERRLATLLVRPVVLYRGDYAEG